MFLDEKVPLVIFKLNFGIEKSLEQLSLRISRGHGLPVLSKDVLLPEVLVVSGVAYPRSRHQDRIEFLWL